MSSETIRMADINSECTTQTRVEACQETIESYADAIRDGAEMPPIEVYYDGEWYWIADGWHRYWASHAAGLEEIEANVSDGGEQEALLAGCGANASHGLRRTNADKRHAVQIVIERLGYWEWSDRMIAETCAVSDKTVARVRRDLKSAKESGVKVLHLNDADTPQVVSGAEFPHLESEVAEEPPKRKGKDGKEYPAPAKTIDEELFGDDEQTDSAGETIDGLAEYTKEVRQNLLQCKKDLKRIAEWHPYIASAFSSLARNLDEVAGTVRQNTAECWCQSCSGDGCDRCLNVGWLTLYAKTQQERK